MKDFVSPGYHGADSIPILKPASDSAKAQEAAGVVNAAQDVAASFREAGFSMADMVGGEEISRRLAEMGVGFSMANVRAAMDQLILAPGVSESEVAEIKHGLLDMAPPASDNQ